MNYLEKNLQCIKKTDEKLYLYLCGLKDCIDYLDKINDKFSVVLAKDGTKIIESINNEIFVSLNSRYSPKEEADRWVKKYDNINKITSLVMFGFGNGIIFESIKKKLDELAYIYIYEPDVDLFLFLVINFDFSKYLLDSKIKFYIKGYNDENLYIDLCKKTNWMMVSTQVICVHPKYDKIYNDEYIKFRRVISEFEYAMKLAKNTAILRSKKFTINAIKNIHFIKESNYLGEFIGKIDRNIPVIIVSAGPSLDKNIDELKKAEKKAFILATDTAVKYLAKHRIDFDAIVTIDGNKLMDHLCDNVCENKCVFTIFDAKNELLEESKGRKVWIYGYGFFEKLYAKYGFVFPEYFSGGSVATAAFWIAKILKSKTVILVGQDLAYLGKSTHAGNVIDRFENEEDIFVEGILEEKVKSRQDWIRYLQWFENVIESEKGMCVIDATEGGAKIKGTKIMKLSEAIDKYCHQKFDFDKLINSMDVTFSDVLYGKFCKDIYNISYEFDEIVKNSKKGLFLAEQIIMIIEQKQCGVKSNVIDVNLKKIRKIQCNIQSKDIYMMLDEYIAEDVSEQIQNIGVKYNNELERLFVIVKNMECIFKSLIKATHDLKPVIDDNIKRI